MAAQQRLSSGWFCPAGQGAWLYYDFNSDRIGGAEGTWHQRPPSLDRETVIRSIRSGGPPPGYVTQSLLCNNPADSMQCSI
jgi:hypothetical protein